MCNYPGWIVTQQEYSELNDRAQENMGALYGFDAPLQAFVRKHGGFSRKVRALGSLGYVTTLMLLLTHIPVMLRHWQLKGALILDDTVSRAVLLTSSAVYGAQSQSPPLYHT